MKTAAAMHHRVYALTLEQKAVAAAQGPCAKKAFAAACAAAAEQSI
jgi:hypothetical protein